MNPVSGLGGLFFGLAFIGGVLILYLFVSCELAFNAVCRAIFAPIGTHKGAGCGSCGYELASLQSGRCCECGADLLKSGVTTRRGIIRVRGSLYAALLGWSYIAFTIAVIVLYSINTLMVAPAPVQRPIHPQINTFEPVRHFYGKEEDFRPPPSFRLIVETNLIENINTPWAEGSLQIKFISSDRQATVEFSDVSSQNWKIRNSDGEIVAAGDRIEPRIPRLAFESIGFDAAIEPLVVSYEEPIVQLANQVLGSPADYIMAYKFRPQSRDFGEFQIVHTGGEFQQIKPPADPMKWLPLVLLCSSALFWIGGMIFIVRRRSRLIEGPRATALAA